MEEFLKEFPEKSGRVSKKNPGQFSEGIVGEISKGMLKDFKSII